MEEYVALFIGIELVIIALYKLRLSVSVSNASNPKGAAGRDGERF